MCFLMLFSIVNIQGNALNAFDNTNEVYSITYHLDGGTNALKNPDAYTAEDSITLMDATKTGYDFAGWFLDSKMTEQISVISNRIGKLNLYAKFTPKSYTATFQDGVLLTVQVEGNTARECYIPYGTIVDPYSEEFMSEYASLSSIYSECSSIDPYFSGWYIVNKYGTKTKLSNSLTMKSDTTIYCDFKHTNSSDIPSWAGSYGGVLSMFSGSSKNSISGSSYRYVRVPTLSTGSFYIQCTLTLGNSISRATVGVYNLTKDEDVKFLSVSHGNYGETYSGTRVFYQANPGDILSIHCDCADYEIFFDGPVRASSTVTSSKTKNETFYYDQIFSPPTPTAKNGYSFLGWYDSQGNKITDTWEYIENQTFTPKWQPIKYYITYNLDGGMNNESNPSSYTIEDNIVLKDPSKLGYTFKGWYSDAEFTTRVTSISKKNRKYKIICKI